jgi:hypothetical protein
MAITNVRTVQRVEVMPGTPDPSLMVVYVHTFDDSTDDQLPIATERTVWLDRYTVTVAEDGTESSAATDVTGEDQLVQDICAAIWTD